MCKCGVWLSSVVIVSSFILVTSFNLDTFNYALLKGTNDSSSSMFGFSVATHREQGRSWVLVGAPTAQSRHSKAEQGGVVFKCSTTSDESCDEIIFNDERSDRGRAIDDKNRQWFGATVSSAGPDMPIVACAPRYVWFTLSREERRDPVGTCYITRNNFRNSSEYSPCRTSLFGYHRQGSCQAGFSAGISKDGKRLFVGAPGSWYWQGQMYSVDPTIKFPFTPGIFGEAFGFNAGSGQVIQQSLDNRPAVMSTPEGPAKDDDSYMGYSMVVGDFNNEGVQGVAVGMPKGGEELEGKVLLYSWSLTNYLNITGEQLGSYFGYALTSSDIDGDQRDDLIIGAPLHTEPNTENKYEVGRVYIAYQGIDSSFKNKGYIDGINSRSRFGLSLASLGDLNLDGYGDFAVGAPYDGPAERGAVYIFQGSSKGVIKRYSQVIFAEDVQSSYHPVTTFGFSIAGGLDLDGNDYPDFAVGAYLSNSAYFFRARPVVKVEAEVKFLTPHKQIFLDQKDCTKPGDASVRVTCTHIEVCMRYTGIGTPSRVEMDIQYILDARKPKYSRMYLGKGTGRTMNTTLMLYKDASRNCDLRDVIYFEEQIIDKLTELEVEVKYSLRDTGYFPQPFQRDPRSILVPIIDLSTPAVVNDSISIYKNCGPDDICIPNLRLIVEKKVDRYIYEIGKSLEFLIEVTNHAEDAYNAKFYVHLPNGIGFKVASSTDKSQNKIYCTQTFNESIFVCDIGNPLVKDTVVSFKLEVEPLRQQKLLKPTYFFYMNVTSANPETQDGVRDNSAEIYIDVWVNAILSIESKSQPVNVYYNTSQYTSAATTWDTEIGPSVLHSYTVTNKGPSDVEEVEIFIIWPLSTLAGEDLLYLLEAPHTLGGVTCEEVDANYKEFTLAVQRGVWETLGIPVELYYKNSSIGFQTQNKTVQPGQTGNIITKTATIVTFYNVKGDVVFEEVITGEPGFEEYWQQISNVAKRFGQPLTVKSNSSTIIEKHSHGQVTTQVSTRPGGIPSIPYTAYQIHSNITTTVTYFDAGGSQRYKEEISGEPGSTEFKKRIKSTIDRYGVPLTVQTNTTRQITYSTFDGKVIYQEILSQTGSENGSDFKTSKTTTVTIVTFTDSKGGVLEKETITSEPTTSAYWEQINAIVAKYDVPVTIQTATKKITTHYVNGIEVNKEEADVAAGQLNLHTDTSTKITFYHDKRFLYEDTIFDEPESTTYNDYVNSIISRYGRQSITINTNTTKTTTYRSPDGRALYTGYVFKQRTETRHPGQQETSRINIVTIVTFSDASGRKLHQETITDQPESSGYWEKINKIVGQYQESITIHAITKKIITYYVNGVEVRKEEGGVDSGKSDSVVNSHIDTVTTITCYSSDRRVLYHDTIAVEIGAPTYNNHIANIVSRFRQPLTINSNMTKTITYRASDGRVMFTGYIYQQKTEYHNTGAGETSRISTITIVTFYGPNGNLKQQETIVDEPGTSVYWEQINKIISRYQMPITIHTNTTKVITYYVNGREVRSEQVAPAVGAAEPSLATHVDVTTTITCYGLSGNVVYTETIPGEPGTASYDSRIATIINSLKQPITININIVKTITYRSAEGVVIHTGSTSEQKTEKHNQNQKETTRTTTVTTIIFYGPDNSVVHKETIRDEPGSAPYWDRIKDTIGRFQVPLNIRTNTTKLITYYVNGKESRNEKVGGNAGMYEAFTTITDVTSVITYYGPDGSVLDRETVRGELTQTDRSERMASFTRRHRGSFTMEIDTTKTITYRSSDGQVLHSDSILDQGKANQESLSRTVTETTFTVYGPDRRKILHQETIGGEPGSEGYNDAIANIITRFTGPITIYTNSTKVITFYTADGRSLNQQTLNEPRSTIQRGGQGLSATDATTYITFYGPDGQAIHHDSLHGAPGPELYQQLDQIAKRYGGVVKSYGGQLNEDGSIGGAVTVVDTPYPGNRPKAFGEHFTEFGGTHGHSGGYNQSSQYNWRNQDSGYNYGSGGSGQSYGQQQSFNLQNLDQQGGLGSYAKGKGLVVGGIDLGTVNSGSVDRNVDGQARSHFDRYSRSGEGQSHDGNHNYLAKDKISKSDSNRRHHGRTKREEDTTGSDIQKLSKCKTSNCIAIRCTTGPLHNGNEVHIALRARINVQTLKNISTTQTVKIQSMLLARISQFQEISGAPAQRTLYRQAAITSVMAPQPDIKPDVVPLWVVVLSAVAGTLILLLLVFLLYKAGFFKRNRPSSAPERQPLNRNGHFQHGDEAL